MDPQPPAIATTASKLRLMCSYGGQIVPRPNTNSLCYLGGDTRIISVPTAATSTISAFTAYISAALRHPPPFILRYQLPNHDLDSLISISSDEDLLIFLEEHLRLSSSPTSLRIRLFLFPVKPNLLTHLDATPTPAGPTQTVLQHPKTEAWFVDALKSARIMQKGFGGDSLSESNGGGDFSGCGGGGGGGLVGQESMVLETSSSFGSTSSSVSLSNVPPMKASAEDNGATWLDNKVTLSSPDSVVTARHSGVTSAISNTPVESYQEPVFAASPNPSESECKIPDPAFVFQMDKTVQFSGYSLPPHLVQQPQQQSDFVHTGTHYIAHNTGTVLPVATYYPTYQQMLPQQAHVRYQSRQPYDPCLKYTLPVGQPRAHSLVNTANLAPTQPTMLPVARLVHPQIAYKEAAVASPATEPYSGMPTTNPLIHVPYNEIQRQTELLPQSTVVASTETTSFSNELDEDPLRAQIYKSQPPPPVLPSQYQTMTKAKAVMFSEAFSQLNQDNVKQHTRT